ncbi:hypothetical protein EJ05DRAFT_433083 [Pseudovirgaria hyperparasitica]|uniref:Rhodanese domain-containing protein n=1 Tax=Pseudovirgaria hyperparasitica TaxID=470096 RepID=A0A6A6WLD1_9PEZI|nr:uncharacterized protein EJ05DRAFT_433083 [Pseudovirgaria hyperparasitica]KAF2762956.1 hypothetical protein EJ05DRAFT_433083 [Pseudovirgaria hyperparasitica]
MSTHSVASLPRITREELRALLTSPPGCSSTSNTDPAPSSTDAASTSTTTQPPASIPARTALPSPVPSSIAIIDVRDDDHIGGHIRGSTHVPSQQLDVRMPELLRLHGDKEMLVFHCALSQVRGPKAALGYLRAREEKMAKSPSGGIKEGQKVCVLQGGFGDWQRSYGKDERVTEAFDEELWEFGGP